MQIVVLDFETFWSQTHSLTKMPATSYVMHPETELISVSVKVDSGRTRVAFGEAKIRALLATIDWSNAAACAHNLSGFDAMIMAWRLGIRPKAWICTLAMAKPIHSKTTGNSLAALVAHYELGVKNNAALINTKGKHLADFTPAEIAAMSQYNIDDTDQCHALLHCLLPHYTAKELWQIDSTIRMLVEPKLVLNRSLLENALVEEKQRKADSLAAIAEVLKGLPKASLAIQMASRDTLQEVVRGELASAPKFSALLNAFGVPVPMKPSPSNPERSIPALAKTDEGFIDLQSCGIEVIEEAARARLDVKSTILETRIESFITVGKLTKGKFPVPLHYCGADTTGRWCLTPDHEVLTPGGWVALSAWKGEPIMQWHAEDASLNWCSSAAVSSFPVDEKLVAFNSEYHRAVYTAEHRVPCKAHRGDAFVSVTASKLAAAKRRAMAVSGTTTEAALPIPEAQLRLTIAMHADGYNVEDDRNNMVRFRFVKPRKVARIKALLEEAHVTYHEHKYPSEPHVTVLTIRGADAPSWLREAKALPSWFYLLSAEQCRVVLDEVARWDGGATGPNSFEWSGCDADAAEKLATVAHLCGYRAKVTLRDRAAPEWSPSYRISFCPKSTYHVMGAHATRVDYCGLVYCPTVDSGFFLCRRQGTIFVTGNSGWLYNPQNLPRVNPKKPKLSDALRKSIRAPKGHKIVVADLSGIELRVNHFLWKVASSMALYQQSPDKADLYRDFAYQLYNVEYDDVTSLQRQVGKVAHLGLGFGAGASTFQKVAKIMGGIDMDEVEAASITQRWRNTYYQIVAGWKTCHSMLPYIAAGDKVAVDPWGLVSTCKQGLLLPSGRIIRYPGLHTELDEDGRSEWWYGKGRGRSRIYAGKIDENCIAEGTLVLTSAGWKEIQNVKASDLVHDGVGFTRHDGIVFKSVQPCVMVDGVFMTPDHEVLTNDGWKEASQVQRPYRPDLRGADSAIPRDNNGEVVEVAVPVHVRESDREAGGRRYERSASRGETQLRVPAWAPYINQEPNPRNVKAPRIRSIPRVVGEVLKPFTQSVGELWGSGHLCVRQVAEVVRGVLGGHGPGVLAGAGHRPQRQQRGLYSRELSLGVPTYERHESALYRTEGGRSGAKREDRNIPQHDILPPSARVVGGGVDARALTSKPVYDILNCGPRARFVVKGTVAPFVVHNCVQALARDVIADNAYAVYKETKLRPSMAVHDELIYVVPESEAEDILELVQAQMRTPPSWWPELVTWSEGDFGDSYGEVK